MVGDGTCAVIIIWTSRRISCTCVAAVTIRMCQRWTFARIQAGLVAGGGAGLWVRNT